MLPGLTDYPVVSRLAYGGAVLLVIWLSSRIERKPLEILNVALGATTLLILTGWRCFLIVCGLNLFVYFLPRRFPAWLNDVLAYVAVFVSAYVLFRVGGNKPLFGGRATQGVLASMGLGAARLCYYMWERPALPAKTSFWSVMS